MLNSAQQSSAMLSDYWWWYVPPALCVALVGIALALLNFGIDEIVNPRLRSARTRHRGVRFTLGLTPVLLTERADQAVRAERATTAEQPTAVAAKAPSAPDALSSTTPAANGESL
jgi:peptide/nickel transport system permease protein